MGGGKNFLVSAAGFSILGNGIFWWKAKTKRLFSQCMIWLMDGFPKRDKGLGTKRKGVGRGGGRV
jgi:hypothetical protein